MAIRRASKWMVIACTALFLAVSPIVNWVDWSDDKVERAEAAGVSLIGGATTSAVIENGKLVVGIRGGAAAGISLGQNYYAQMKLPDGLGYLLRQDNIRKHIRLDYRLPAPLLGVIPIRGTVPGDFLTFDRDNNIVMGKVKVPLNLSLISIFEFKFYIDLEALGATIAPGQYDVKINVGDTQLDLDLLSFRQSLARLVVEGDGDYARTDVRVTILPEELPPPVVVDPENPTRPYEPGDPPSGNTGALTLDHVSSIAFGIQEIDAMTSEYDAETVRPFLQVTDRRGTGAGWTIMARAGRFHDASSGKETLPGAVLSLMDGTAISAGEGVPPNVSPSIGLVTGGESVMVLRAIPGSGLGTWTTRWLPSGSNQSGNNDNVRLEIPGGVAAQGEHISEISWTLVDGP